MKISELFEVFNDNQCVDLYYKDKHDELVKCASQNNLECVDDKYADAKVINISVTKYNTFDVLIEKPIVNKRYRVRFEIPDWLDLEEEMEFEFEDDESEDDITERIEDEFSDWLDDKLRGLRDEATHEVVDIEEY